MRRLIVAVGLAALSLVLAVGASASSSSTTYTDPTGDAGTAADVTNVVVSNDPTGQITFQVNIANQFTATNTVEILVDSDNNGSTGDSQAGGVEYDLFFDFSDHTWDLGFYNGSGWSEAPSSSTVHVTYTPNQLTYSINKSDLGNTSAFGFWVDSCDADCSAGHEDQAPTNGLWAYQLATAVRLSVVFAVAPTKVKAGGVYTAALIVQRSDTNGFLGTEGQIQCKAAVGGKSIAAVGGFISQTYQGAKVSVAICAAHVPKTARGKTLTGSITVSYQGATATRSFFAHVTK